MPVRPPQQYFDLLPEPILEQIARHVSVRPCRLNWETYITPRDSLALLTGSDALRDAILPLFTHLTIADSGARPAASGIVALVDTPADASHTLALITTLNSSLQSLTIDHQRRHSSAQSWLSVFAERCTEVRTLVIKRAPGPLELLLRAARGRLTALTLGAGLQSVDIIATNCTGLRKLELGFHVFLFPIVFAQRDSLEELSFHLSAFSASTAQHVMQYCRNLHRIEVHVSERSLSGALGQLFASYGPQLRDVRVVGESLTAEHLSVVAAACPNVRLDVEIPVSKTPAEVATAIEMGILAGEAEETFAETVLSMGDRLFALRWSGKRDVRGELNMLGCSNLRKITLTEMRYDGVKVLSALLGIENMVLENIELAFAEHDVWNELDEEMAGGRPCIASAVEEAMYVLSCNAKAVRTFKMTAVPTAQSVFYAFARANSNLKNVHIVFLKGDRPVSRFRKGKGHADGAPDVELHVLQAVDAFAKCTTLQSLVVTDTSYCGIEEAGIMFPAVTWACRLMRKRSANVVVCDVEYS